MPCSSFSVDSRRLSMPVPLNSRSVLDNEYGRMKYTYSSCNHQGGNSSEEKSPSKHSKSKLTKTVSRSSASADDRSDKLKSCSNCSNSSKKSGSSHSRKPVYTTYDINEYRKTHGPGTYLSGSSRSSLRKHSPSVKSNIPTLRLRGASVQTVDLNRRTNSSESSSSAEESTSRQCKASMSFKKVPSSSSSENSGLSGLLNIGNTCFLNSVVQCLSNTRPLKDFFVSREYLREIRNSESKGALIRAFAEVVTELWSGEGKVVNTTTLKSQIQRYAPRFMGYNQQDAQEFLRYLLEGIHDDINRVSSKPKNLPEIDNDLSDSVKAAECWKQYIIRVDNSKIVELFVGQLKSTLQCTTCGHKSTTFEAFWDLSLPLPSRGSSLRLSQCLDHFTKEEVLDGNEMATCAKCKTRRKSTKRFSIQKLPKILVLHLKRFSPNDRYRKLTVSVDFPLTGLDMSPYSSSQQTSTYNLYAVSNHSGSTHSGHYTAYCFHPGTRQWYEFNDSRVCQISSRNVVSSEGYILFYEQASNSPKIST